MTLLPQLLHSTSVGTARRIFAERLMRPLALDCLLFGKAIAHHLESGLIGKVRESYTIGP
jgi:hypothetical protein